MRLLVILQSPVILARKGDVQWLMYSEVRTTLTLFLCCNGGTAVQALWTAEINALDQISLFEKVYLLQLGNFECYVKLYISLGASYVPKQLYGHNQTR